VHVESSSDILQLQSSVDSGIIVWLQQLSLRF